MNKKFSTLLASALLASAFSTASAEINAGLNNVKEGDVVALFTVDDGSKMLQLQGDGTVLEQTVANAFATEYSDVNNNGKEFTNAQSALWKIASVKTSETGIPVYQFVNKATGVYLAVDLETAPETRATTGASVSANAAKLSSTGNKNWSLKDGALYAYANDSIYSLVVRDSKVKLQAVKGNISESGVTTGAQALYIADLHTGRAGNEALPLSANAFNKLMGLTGNDGKLHFNNNKDVTSTQKNILKDTKWTAEAKSDALTTLYFTNGKTVEGYNDAASEKVQKKQYLMIDTTYYDANTPAYFKLTVDTLGYAITGAGTGKPVDKRPLKAAQFTAKYFYANDSIAIMATNAPKQNLNNDFYPKSDANTVETESYANPIALRSLADVTVLTVASTAVTAASAGGYVLPLIQPFATSGGDATEIAATKVFNLQIKNEAKDHSLLRASKLTDKYLVAASTTTTAQVEEVDASNVYAQWAFVPGVSGYYTIQNRAIPELVYYAGPVSKVKDANGKVVADTYVLGTDTLKVAAVTLNEDNFYTEKVNNKNVKYDYSGAYYTGKTDGISQSFIINPVSPFLSTLAAQTTKDSVMVLGATEEAVVWSLVKAGDPVVYGLEIEGLPRLKKQLYYIATFDADNNKYYVQANDGTDQFEITKADSRAEAKLTKFEIRNVAEGQYNLIATTEGDVTKMTINATPAKPILESSNLTSEKNDLFALNKSQVNLYRKLTAEDGVLGNAKIFMNNENSRYLYENSQNIVANNGNKIAKDSLNFLGIFNTAALTKNAALYVDTAYVEREGVYMPQYMFALGVTEVEAHDAIACSYEHNHFDNAGNKVDALHCSHATPATLGYKAGRYLVALTDSIEGVNNHPGRYDGATRLAFVDAIHRVAEDSLIIKNSKWTDNSKQIVEGEEKTYASKDTIKIADNALNVATFALLIKDQADQSFYLQTAGGYVRILNGVPVLTDDKEDAAVFNIAATEEEATANEAIEAAGVQVIGGKGAVTVQGAAGKVITVADILGRTIANQVAASDNVTIAAPAGIVVVAVEGEATKVVVK